MHYVVFTSAGSSYVIKINNSMTMGLGNQYKFKAHEINLLFFSF